MAMGRRFLFMKKEILEAGWACQQFVIGF